MVWFRLPSQRQFVGEESQMKMYVIVLVWFLDWVTHTITLEAFK